MTTAGQQQANPARVGGLAKPSGLGAGSPRHGQETTHRPTETGPDGTRADARRKGAAARLVNERARAARSAGCPYPAGPGDSSGPSRHHLAPYLRAGQRSTITSQSLRKVTAGRAARDPLHAAQRPE